MSNFHFDLSLKLPQGEVHDFSGEVQNDLRGERHTSPQNPAMPRLNSQSLKIELFCFCEEFKVLFKVLFYLINWLYLVFASFIHYIFNTCFEMNGALN
jgi:hypothetical protein